MGVAVPDDYRQAVAMPGDWQTVAERPIWNNVKKEESLEDIKDFEPGSTLNVGVRKRKFEGHEEEEGAGATVVKKGWGLAMRRYPGAGGGEDDDLDMLLSTKPMSEPGSHSQSEKASAHLNAGDLNASQRPRGVEAATHVPPVKQEESNESVDLNGVPSQNGLSEAMVKQEDDSIPSAVVFKKRKAKSSAILS